MRFVNPIRGGVHPATGAVRPITGSVRPAVVRPAHVRYPWRRWYPWYYPVYYYPYPWYGYSYPWYGYGYPRYGYGYPYQERVVCERIVGDAECPNNTIVRYNADGSKTCCPPY